MQIRWRSQNLLASDMVTIELTHGGVDGPVELVITPGPGVPNVGSFFWTVPFFVPPASDYTIVISRASALVPGTFIDGASPFEFAIDADTRRPVVLNTTPEHR